MAAPAETKATPASPAPAKATPPKRIRLAVPADEEAEFATEPTFPVEYPADGRKLDVLRKNPLVPIGAGVTAAVLLAGLFAFNRGSQLWSQRMMRARVFAQGATLVVLAGSVIKPGLGVALEDEKEKAAVS